MTSTSPVFTEGGISTHRMTLSELSRGIIEGIKAGLYTGDEVFVVSKDPEGNGFLAFECFVEVTTTSRTFQAAPGYFHIDKWRDRMSEDPNDVKCAVLMSLYEIDPEF